MLARLVRELPQGALCYEPKWDGFRCLVFRDGDAIELRSRHDRPLGRYFPEVCAALRALPAPSCVLDGELLVTRDGRHDFGALLERVHPAASRVARLAAETPAYYVAFDLLALGGSDLRDEPYRDRRGMLTSVLDRPDTPVTLTPSLDAATVARRWLGGELGAGFDGVMAKPVESTYQPGRRGWWKVKPERTADCVVAGCRVAAGSEVSSLLLGLYDHEGMLRHVGVTAAFAREQRRTLLPQLMEHAVELRAHPWREGYALEGGPAGRLAGSAGRWTPAMPLDWIPLRPELVCEVAYDRPDGSRLRHPARFRRWRPDRTPESCRVDQLTEAVTGWTTS
ncbi:ATP-dependent DNA ligase [Micromonospora pattaloongensis]|uniref:DNA ligase (ATP) n=2 Tax=Micromonospora pattaloongensis TaxID=405436 RepID=A0A1H3JEZ7_9ACTN|nr:ATP-dependent DNA ligase [Micromonospora pattaloongensis]